MPKTRKEFIKIVLDLFEDDNYFTLPPLDQLIYLKLIAINKRKRNQTPKKLDRLIPLLKLQLSSSDLKVILKRLKRRFHNFKSNRWFYYFDDYDKWYDDGKKNSDKGTGKNQKGDGDIEIDIEKEKDIDKEQPSAVKTALEKVYKTGFNIYSLINKIKKELKWAKDRRFPDEVLLGVCEAYWRDKDKIRSDWAWFVRVLEAKSNEYYAQKNITEHQTIKKQEAISLKEIMKGIGEEK